MNEQQVRDIKWIMKTPLRIECTSFCDLPVPPDIGDSIRSKIIVKYLRTGVIHTDLFFQPTKQEILDLRSRMNGQNP